MSSLDYASGPVLPARRTTRRSIPTTPTAGRPSRRLQQPRQRRVSDLRGQLLHAATTRTTPTATVAAAVDTGGHCNMLTWGQLEAHYAYNDFKDDDRLDGDSGFGVDLRVKLMKPIYLHFGLDRLTEQRPRIRHRDHELHGRWRALCPDRSALSDLWGGGTSLRLHLRRPRFHQPG